VSELKWGAMQSFEWFIIGLDLNFLMLSLSNTPGGRMEVNHARIIQFEFLFCVDA
jgi:hypothetical protein